MHTTINLNNKTLDVEFDYEDYPFGIKSIELAGKDYREVLARFKRSQGIDLEQRIEEKIINDLID